jgi:hypothetical protein
MEGLCKYKLLSKYYNLYKINKKLIKGNCVNVKEIGSITRSLKKYSIKSKKTFKVYRGTDKETLFANDSIGIEPKLRIVHPLSCTLTRKVAKDFAGKKGFIHVIEVTPRCEYIDTLSPDIINTCVKYAKAHNFPCGYEKMIYHEKEIIVMYKNKILLTKRKGNTFYWKLVPVT